MALAKPKPKTEVENKPETVVEEQVEQTENPAPVEEQEPEKGQEQVQPEVVEEQEPETDTPIKETSESKVVATTSSNTQAMAQAGSKFSQEAADDGFEGLEIGFGSFPMITLPGEAVFMLSEGEVDLGKTIQVVIQQSRAKYVYRNSDDDDVVAFSYDKVTIAGSDEPLENTLAQWKAEGADVEIKKYLECTAIIHDCSVPEHNGSMVLLSLPPTAVNKFSGYIAQLRFSQNSPRDVITECYVGAKVTGVSNPFYPWAFRVVKQEG